MKILFICKWNRFRSKFAEIYFNQIKNDKKIRAKSVGILEVNIPLKKSEIERNKFIKEKFGIILNEKSKGINVKDLDEADKIIVIADDVPLSILKSKKRWEDKFIIWKIKDGNMPNKEDVRKIVISIKGKVEDLIKQLEKRK